MKNKIILLITFLSLFSCKIQQTQTNVSLPKIENYTKGELEIKIISFGENNPITIGKIMADGTIHFNWPKLDLSKINEDKYFTRLIKNFIGGKFCNDPNVIFTNDKVKLVENKFIYLFKYGQAVGTIIPSTQKGKEHNKKQLGSTINWIYSYNETNAKANCNEKKEWKGRYSFDQTTTYDLKFKKGFNLVSNTVTVIEEWDNGEIKGNLPKNRIIKSIDRIPSNIHWHLKYWVDDELLEIEHQLFKLKPINKQQYESWLPKKLGNLERISYEIGKKLKRMPTLNNVNFLFKKDAKTINLTIVDCAGNKDVASVYTLMKDIASRDWKDDKGTGYESASSMDGKRVMTTYNEKEAKTTLNYNSNERFLVKAEAINIKAEELWKILKNLEIEKLINTKI